MEDGSAFLNPGAVQQYMLSHDTVARAGEGGDGVMHAAHQAVTHGSGAIVTA